MSSEEFELRGELLSVVNSIEAVLERSKAIFTTDVPNPQDLTRDELIALKSVLLDAYTISATTMGVIKRLNANSRSQNSSLKATPVVL